MKPVRYLYKRVDGTSFIRTGNYGKKLGDKTKSGAVVIAAWSTSTGKTLF